MPIPVMLIRCYYSCYYSLVTLFLCVPSFVFAHCTLHTVYVYVCFIIPVLQFVASFDGHNAFFSGSLSCLAAFIYLFIQSVYDHMTCSGEL